MVSTLDDRSEGPQGYGITLPSIMHIKNLLGISGCSVLGTLLTFAVLLIVLLALVIPQLPFGQRPAWEWMLGTPQPVNQPLLPPSEGKPIITGDGQWCVTRAYQETPQESHLNAGRVQGYVRDVDGRGVAGIAVHVSWDGDEGGITRTTEVNGYYVFILSPGEYRVQVAQGKSQVVGFRTNLREWYGHYTYDVDFAQGDCISAVGNYSHDSDAPQGMPVSGRLTAAFHDWSYFRRFGRIHEGVDLAVVEGTAVMATMSGRVAQAGSYGAWGNMVLLQNGPWEIIVAHLSKVEVSLGQIITSGTRLGSSGNTGVSTGPHVHYEVRYNGLPLNPSELGR